MIVVDASALVELLLQTAIGRKVEVRLLRRDEEWHVPHLVDVEVLQALRRLVRAREISEARAAEAVADLADLDLHRHAHVDLLEHAWALRDNITAYDAIYLVLAEALDATVVTCDRALGRTPGHRVRMDVVA